MPTIKFLSMIPGVKEAYPIKPISSYRPSWLNEEATQYAKEREQCKHNPLLYLTQSKSIAKCVGIRKIYSTGWVIPAWQDIIINYNPENGDWSWHTAMDQTKINPKLNPYIVEHDANSFRKCPHLRQNPIIKIESPWLAKIPKGYSILQLPFPYKEHDNFDVAVGIFNKSFGLMELNVQMFWKKPGATLIPAGTPLSHIMLIKDEEYEQEISDITPEEEKEWEAQKIIRNTSFDRNYQEIKQTISKVNYE